MTSLFIASDDDRSPLWRFPEMLDRAAAMDKLESVQNAAVCFKPEDAQHAKAITNFHTLFLGPRRRLNAEAEYLFDAVRSQFDYSRESAWVAQKAWFLELVRSFFPEDDPALGTFSITPMRRPAPVREAHDPGIRILHPFPIAGFEHIKDKRSKLHLGNLVHGQVTLPLAGSRMSCSFDSHPKENTLAQIFVKRELQARQFGIAHAHYSETWVCRAREGQGSGDTGDDIRLGKGQIPAVAPGFYQGRGEQLRTAPILDLAKIDGIRNYCSLAVEIHPGDNSGEVLSFRSGTMPLDVGLLCVSPVEHAGICQTLRKILK